MTTRDRERERVDRSLVLRDGSGSGDGPSATDVHERARRLANTADHVINATLSEDSTQFLSQNRQEGGQ